MGLGLSLLQLLSVAQLRAVLAHEFGHFHGGDTRLAPWVYKTRAAIGRTLAGLGERAKLVHIPFELYGNFFLRVTQVLRPWYRSKAEAGALALDGLVAERLPEVAARVLELDRALDTSGEVVAEGVRRQRGAWFLGVVLADALAGAGWVVESSPGRPVRLTRGQSCIEPFGEAQALVKGRTSPDEWRERCQMWGINGLVLAERPPS